MRFINWIKQSNRYKHLLYAIPCGFLLGPLFVLGLALGMEFKDKQWGGKFSWIDFWLTLLGGIIGTIISVSLILLIA